MNSWNGGLLPDARLKTVAKKIPICSLERKIMKRFSVYETGFKKLDTDFLDDAKDCADRCWEFAYVVDNTADMGDDLESHFLARVYESYNNGVLG